MPLKSARLFFDLSEKVRQVLESYFRLDSPLYFSYSHLVCRSAVDDKQEGREDLSHPVHVDNCLLVSELNECIKEPPAYTQRDYSAILYLNDDFEGGDFIFTMLDAKTVTAEVRPQCGRVVGFEAGKENPHGVRAVTKGQRCAVALWFTLDPIHEEKERIQAQDLLKMFSSPLDAEFRETMTQTDNRAETKTTDQLESSEPLATHPKQATPTVQEVQQQATKSKDKPAEQKPQEPTDLQAEKTTDKGVEKPKNIPSKEVEKAEVNATSKAKAKLPAASKAKVSAKTTAKVGDKAKAKSSDKTKAAKPAAKTSSKQAVKTKPKQADKKEQKPNTKKTEKASVKKDPKVHKTDLKPDSDSQKDRDEL